MADWIILLLLVALGLGGYRLMGRLGDFLAGNLARNATKAKPVEGWTPQTISLIMGIERRKSEKEGKVHGRDANASLDRSAGTPHGCAG